MIKWSIDNYGCLTLSKGEEEIFIQNQDDVQEFLNSINSDDTSGEVEDKLGYFS